MKNYNPWYALGGAFVPAVFVILAIFNFLARPLTKDPQLRGLLRINGFFFSLVAIALYAALERLAFWMK